MTRGILGGNLWRYCLFWLQWNPYIQTLFQCSAFGNLFPCSIYWPPRLVIAIANFYYSKPLLVLFLPQRGEQTVFDLGPYCVKPCEQLTYRLDHFSDSPRPSSLRVASTKPVPRTTHYQSSFDAAYQRKSFYFCSTWLSLRWLRSKWSHRQL